MTTNLQCAKILANGKQCPNFIDPVVIEHFGHPRCYKHFRRGSIDMTEDEREVREKEIIAYREFERQKQDDLDAEALKEYEREKEKEKKKIDDVVLLKPDFGIVNVKSTTKDDVVNIHKLADAIVNDKQCKFLITLIRAGETPANTQRLALRNNIRYWFKFDEGSEDDKDVDIFEQDLMKEIVHVMKKKDMSITPTKKKKEETVDVEKETFVALPSPRPSRRSSTSQTPSQEKQQTKKKTKRVLDSEESANTEEETESNVENDDDDDVDDKVAKIREIRKNRQKETTKKPTKKSTKKSKKDKTPPLDNEDDRHVETQAQLDAMAEDARKEAENRERPITMSALDHAINELDKEIQE